MCRKRYGLIMERLYEEQWKYVNIVYYDKLEEALEAKEHINNSFTFRVFGIFDYENAVYKYIIGKEEI